MGPTIVRHSLFWNSQGTCNKHSDNHTSHDKNFLASNIDTRAVQGIDFE